MELTQQWLVERYVDQGLSIRECAKLVHCKRDKIKQALDRYGIKRKANPATPRPTMTINGVKHNACSCCGKIKPVDQFRKDAHAPNGHKIICIECDKAAKAERRRQYNPDLPEYVPIDQRDEQKQQQAISHWMNIRPVILFYWLLVEMCGDELSEMIRLRQQEKERERYESKRSDILARLREKYKSDSKFMFYHRQKRQKGKAIRKGLKATLSWEEWQEALFHFNDSCAYCGSIQDIEQDHVVPASRGGAYVRDNIVPACHECNDSKRSRELVDWYKEQPFFSEERLRRLREWQSMGDNKASAS